MRHYLILRCFAADISIRHFDDAAALFSFDATLRRRRHRFIDYFSYAWLPPAVILMRYRLRHTMMPLRCHFSCYCRCFHDTLRFRFRRCLFA